MLRVRKSSPPLSSLTVSWQPKPTVSYKTRSSLWQGTSPLGLSSSERLGEYFTVSTENRHWYQTFYFPESTLFSLRTMFFSSPQPFLLPLWHPADVILCNCLRSRQSHATLTGHKPWDQPVGFSGQQSCTASWQEKGAVHGVILVEYTNYRLCIWWHETLWEWTTPFWLKKKKI